MDAWSDYCATTDPADWHDLEAFKSYCEANGIAIAAKPESVETLGKPGELYSHLKAVPRGIDHRKPLAFGERPTLTPIIQPEAQS
jgi:hypothetical protein